jgi:hypothetical protein
MKSIIKEPLLHFLLLGGVLLYLYSFVQDDTGLGKKAITVSEARIEQLEYRFKKTYQRMPDERERKALIDDYLKEEVAYKKGIEMGLLEGDSIIKKRVRQKLEFIIEDVVNNAEPNDQQLMFFLQGREDEYRSDEHFSFLQVYLNPNKHSDIKADMGDLLRALQEQSEKSKDGLGDPIFLDYVYTDITYRDVARFFGSEFAESLKSLDSDVWQQGIRSGYGEHIVMLTKKSGGELQPLNQIREPLKQAWLNQQRQDTLKKFYESLFKEYNINY